jgi:hypothetical protein
MFAIYKRADSAVRFKIKYRKQVTASYNPFDRTSSYIQLGIESRHVLIHKTLIIIQHFSFNKL